MCSLRVTITNRPPQQEHFTQSWWWTGRWCWRQKGNTCTLNVSGNDSQADCSRHVTQQPTRPYHWQLTVWHLAALGDQCQRRPTTSATRTSSPRYRCAMSWRTSYVKLPPCTGYALVLATSGSWRGRRWSGGGISDDKSAVPPHLTLTRDDALDRMEDRPALHYCIVQSWMDQGDHRHVERGCLYWATDM